jgi:heat shock protein HslJ
MNFRHVRFAGWLIAVMAMLAGLMPQTASRAETSLSPGIIGKTWRWVSFISPVEKVMVDASDRYTIEFMADGSVAIGADCNRAMGSFTVSADRRISFGQLATTRALCPEGSLSDRYLRELSRVNSYFQKDGDFFLELPFDSGTLRFTVKP